ncbi:MAG: hypothetical protein ACE363_14670 [Alphaproteobacteria bacterium]
MELSGDAAMRLFVLFFVGPPVLGALIGAFQMKQSRFRGAVIGGAVGMMVGYAAFQIIVLNEIDSESAPQQEAPDSVPMTPSQVPLSTE